MKITKPAPPVPAVSGDPEALDRFGLEVGSEVRFRLNEAAQWTKAVAVTVEMDGSIGLRDERGRRRSVHPERIQVAEKGPRGGRTWTPIPTETSS